VPVIKQFSPLLQEIMNFAGQHLDGWTLNDALIKGAEEAGELATVVLIVGKRISHKTLPEIPSGEIADNINQIIDVLSFYDKDQPISLDNVERTTASSIQDYAQEFACPDNITPLNNVICETFLAYQEAKYQYNRNTCHRAFNSLVNDLVIFNCLLIAAHENKTIKDINDDFFEHANAILQTQLVKKLKKWIAI
jgi:hypothetical protein